MTQVKLMTEENGLEVLQERINKFIKDNQQSIKVNRVNVYPVTPIDMEEYYMASIQYDKIVS